MLSGAATTKGAPLRRMDTEAPAVELHTERYISDCELIPACSVREKAGSWRFCREEFLGLGQAFAVLCMGSHYDGEIALFGRCASNLIDQMVVGGSKAAEPAIHSTPQISELVATKFLLGHTWVQSRSRGVPSPSIRFGAQHLRGFPPPKHALTHRTQTRGSARSNLTPTEPRPRP